MPRGTEHPPINRLGLMPTPNFNLTSQLSAQFPDVEEVLDRLENSEMKEIRRG